MVKVYVLCGGVVVETRWASCLASAKLFRRLAESSGRGVTVLIAG